MASVRTVSEPQEILAYVQHPPNGEGDSERAALQMCTRLQINMLQIDNAIIQLVLVYLHANGAHTLFAHAIAAQHAGPHASTHLSMIDSHNGAGQC